MEIKVVFRSAVGMVNPPDEQGDQEQFRNPEPTEALP